MEITVLCKVVDNFGDIGVVWRLSRQLKRINSSSIINLIVDDLSSFQKLCNKVEIDKKFQIVNEINVYKWDAFEFCHDEFIKNDGEKLELILECFQCGRPDWMEKILFEEKLERTVQIIMIDYLTAEDYAETFHCMESLTRSRKVKKVNFMPGFTEKTGGLIIDNQWEKLEKRQENGPVLVFTYERDWAPFVRALNECENKVLLGQGRGQLSFVKACENENNAFELVKLDFLNQNEWDEMMKTCSVLFIRGEESLSRACLSGIPFVWHAYPQSEEYQLVKMNALLERIKKYFSEELFLIISRVWNAFNRPENEVSFNEMKTACMEFLKNKNDLSDGFSKFALDLRKNGDLCANLMTFINKITIIDK